MNIKNILDILFKITKKSANILADIYLIKDVSTISKWKNNKVIIKSDDINKIVQFAINESSLVQRKMIREEIEVLINNSVLSDSIKEMIFDIENFGKFLEEALNVSTSLCDDTSVFGKISPLLNGTYRNRKDSSRGNSGNDEDAIPAELGKNADCEYSGVMKFDLFLSENKKNKSKGGTGKPDIKLKSDIDFINKNKTGGIRKYVGIQTVFSIILLLVVLNFTLFQSANSSKDTEHAVYIELEPTEVKAIEVKAIVPVKEENTPVKKEPAPVSDCKPQGKTAGKLVPKSAQINDEQNINVDLDINNGSRLNIGIGKNIYITRDGSASSDTILPTPTASKSGLN